MIANKLKDNLTLIEFDYSMNDFQLEDSRAIQSYMKRNKELYDQERQKEYQERKGMKAEESQLRELYLKEQAQQELEHMEEEVKEAKEKEVEL